MSVLTLNESAAAPSAPAAGKVSLYADNTADPCIRMIDDAGRDLSLFGVVNQSVAAQGPIAAATRTYITGSAIRIPKKKLQVGTVLRWRFTMTKTAAGVAASTFDICFGTAGTTADTARVSFTKPAGTAVVDEGVIEIMATVRSIGAAGVVVGNFRMTHNLQITGHATIPCVAVTTVSAGFDTTVVDLIAGVCITSGASDAITVQMCQAEGWNI